MAGVQSSAVSEPRAHDGCTQVRRGVVMLRVYLCLLAFVAPLRFGSVITPGEIASFPASAGEWLLGSWPPCLLGGLAGVGLLWAVWLRGPSLRQHPAFVVLCVWGALPLVALLGLLHTSEWDVALTFVPYLFGIVSFLAASLKVSQLDPQYRPWLIRAVVAGTIVCGVLGWYQRLWGFEEMRRFALLQAAQTGRELSVAMQGKLAQTRVHRPFFLPNSYAAHLILTAPLVLLTSWRAGGRVEPARVSRVVFVSVAAILVLGALLLSQSRGALLAAGGGMGLALFCLPAWRRWRWALLGVGVLAGLGLMLVVNQGRDLLSASARFQYYTTALRIFAGRPFVGAGLGEFFPAYLALKPLGAEETRAAHNVILAMLSEVGILGGVAAAACMGLPLGLALFSKPSRNVNDVLLRAAVVGGVGAWSIHALLDFNILIPPTVMLAATLPIYCFDTAPAPSQCLPVVWRERVLLLTLALLACLGFWRLPGEKRYRDLNDMADGGAFRDLREQLEATTVVLPFSPYPWALYGHVALAKGRPVAAAEAYEQAVRRTPHRASFLLDAAKARLCMGDHGAARSLVEKAWTAYPGSAEAASLNALMQLLSQPASAAARDPHAWIAAVLNAHAGGRLVDGAFVVHLDTGATSTMGGPGGLQLSTAFNECEMVVPGSGTPVHFE